MRYSQQRQQVYEALCSTKSHPDAQWVYNKVRETIPNVSLGTVYRNLSELVECGKARRVSVVGNIDRFDSTTSRHAHFVCTQCGAILDMGQAAVQCNNTACCKVEDVDVIYYGACNKCVNNK